MSSQTSSAEQAALKARTSIAAVLSGVDQAGSRTTRDAFMTASELANILGVHENWVYAQAKSGSVPSYKFGGNRRFRWSEIDKWLEGQKC